MLSLPYLFPDFVGLVHEFSLDGQQPFPSRFQGPVPGFKTILFIFESFDKAIQLYRVVFQDCVSLAVGCHVAEYVVKAPDQGIQTVFPRLQEVAELLQLLTVGFRFHGVVGLDKHQYHQHDAEKDIYYSHIVLHFNRSMLRQVSLYGLGAWASPVRHRCRASTAMPSRSPDRPPPWMSSTIPRPPRRATVLRRISR